MLSLIFLLALVVAGALGRQVLKRIFEPLDELAEQARAIGEDRFISVPEPKTLELRPLANAMNEMSAHIKRVLHQEAKRQQKWQREAHVDKVTGLNNREPFIKSFEAALQSNDVNATGSLSLARMTGLAKLNQVYGRSAMDAVLHEMGNELNRITTAHYWLMSARRNPPSASLTRATSKCNR